MVNSWLVCVTGMVVCITAIYFPVLYDILSSKRKVMWSLTVFFNYITRNKILIK